MLADDPERFLSRAWRGARGYGVGPEPFLGLPLAAPRTATAVRSSLLEPQPRPDGPYQGQRVIPVVGPNEDAGRVSAPPDDEAAASLADETGTHRHAGAQLPLADAGLRPE